MVRQWEMFRVANKDTSRATNKDTSRVTMDASREDLIKGAHTPGRDTMASSSRRAEGYARRAAARRASRASPACAAPVVKPSPACSAWQAMMMTTEHFRRFNSRSSTSA